MELTYVVVNTINSNYRFGLIYVGHDLEQAMKCQFDSGFNNSRMVVFVGNEIVAEISITPEGFKRAFE